MSAFSFRAMTEVDAHAIEAWRYPAPYSFYDPDADAADLAELLDPARRRGEYFAADAGGALAGFLQLRRAGDAVDVGLGLRPDLTGRGLGLGFLEAGLDFARASFAPGRFTLAVTTWNARAIRVYGRAGFTAVRTFVHETNGGVHEFLAMERPA